MTARDAGGIACRIFALFLAFLGFRNAVGVLIAIPIYKTGFSLSNFGQDPFWIMVSQTILYFVAALVCWVKAPSLWPHDNALVANPSLDGRAWIRVGILVLGAYFLLQSLPVALLVFAKWFFQNIDVPSVSAARADEDLVAALIAIIMIIYGSIGWPRAERDDAVEA